MQGTKGLFNSKRGVFALFVLLTATVLAVLHVITGSDWIGLAKWISLTVIAGHTASSVVDSVMAKKPQPVQTPTASS